MIREIGFDIVVGSEIMVVLVFIILMFDMREWLGNMVVGISKGGDFVIVDDLGIGGVFIVFMKDVIYFILM